MGHAHRACAWVLTSALLFAGCGGGRNAIIGVANTGNRVLSGELSELADMIAEDDSIPEVTDEELLRAFSSIRGHAIEGDPEAALILYLIARGQRSDD